MAIFIIVIELLFLRLANTVEGGEVSDLLAIAFIMSFSLLYCGYYLKEKDSRNNYLVLGYILRLSLLLFDLYGRYIYTLPNSGMDTEGFFRFSVQYAHGIPTKESAFVLLMGTYFRLFGISRIYGQFLLMLCSMVSMKFLLNSFDELQINNEIQIKVIRIVALLPNFAILSSIFLRESLVTMFVSISVFFFCRWFARRKLLYYFLAMINIFIASLFHSGCVSIAMGYILVLLIYDNQNKKINVSPSRIIITAVLLLLFVFVFNRYGDIFFSKMTGLNTLKDISATNEAGGSSYARYVGNSNNMLNILIFTIPRILYFIFSPFPWQWRGLSDIIAFVFSSMFYLICTIQTFNTLRTTTKNHAQVITISMILICGLFVFAWGTSNTGTAVRHRDKLIIIQALLYGICLEIKKQEYEANSEKTGRLFRSSGSLGGALTKHTSGVVS